MGVGVFSLAQQEHLAAHCIEWEDVRTPGTLLWPQSCPGAPDEGAFTRDPAVLDGAACFWSCSHLSALTGPSPACSPRKPQGSPITSRDR